MSENAEQRSGNVEKLETGGTAVPPVSPVPANDLDNESPPAETAEEAVLTAEAAPQAVSPEPTSNDVAPPQPERKRKLSAKTAPLADPALEDMVRRGDEDRWLASRFAPEATRRKLIALYAFNIEIASIAGKVTDTRLGELRLQWWRDTVETIFRGGPVPDHPVSLALAEVIKEAHLPLDLFDALLTARVLDFNPAPFETWGDLDAYIDGATGALMRMAAIVCAPDVPLNPVRTAGLQTASRAWGYLNLLRASNEWTARGRTFYPANLRGSLGIAGKAAPQTKEEAAFAFAAHAVLNRSMGAQNNMARYAQAFPKEMYPAIGYLALAPLYTRAESHRELGREPKPPSLFKRQWKMVFAASRGALT